MAAKLTLVPPIVINPPQVTPKFPRFCGTIYFSFDAEDEDAAFAYLHGVASQLNAKDHNGEYGEAGVKTVKQLNDYDDIKVVFDS